MSFTEENIVAQTQEWIKKAVIGLNLCPFAQAVHIKNQIRYVVSKAQTVESLLAEVKMELKTLIAVDPQKTETTLIIHPHVLNVFSDYVIFLEVIDQVLVEMKLEGELQIASFHPYYQFAGTQPDDIENYTNRSPFPILQILRESSVEKGLEAFANPDEIFERNIETMRCLGHAGWKKLTDSSG